MNSIKKFVLNRNKILISKFKNIKIYFNIIVGKRDKIIGRKATKCIKSRKKDK